MPVISDTQLGKEIRSSQLNNCYFLYGKERFHVDKAVSAISRKIVPLKEEEYGVERFDEKASVSDINAAMEAVSFFAHSKCVIVRDFPLASLSEEECSLLLDTIAESAPEAVLIFCYMDTQPDVKNAKVKKVMDAFAKYGSVTCFAPKDNITQRRQVQEMCKKSGVSIDAAGADALVSRFHEDSYHLRSETEKMISYALAKSEDNAVITVKDVDLMCVDTIENTVFDLTDAILGGNHRRVFGLLERLFERQTEGLSITGALTTSFTDLYRARIALDASVAAKQTATDFAYPAKREFIVARSYARAERYSARQLRQCFAIIGETTGLLMGSKTDERLVIERMIGRMLSVMAGGRR